MNFLATCLLLLTVKLCYAAEFDSQTPVLKKVWGSGTHLEGPHWSVTDNVLYWVDISEQLVHRLDPSTGNITTRRIAFGPVTPAVTVKDNPGLLLICARTELFFMAWNATPGDMSMRLLSAIDLGHPDNRCNDGKVDAKGRMWIGTMGREVKGNVDGDQGSLYMLDQRNYLHPEVKVRPVSVSNGMAWTANNKYMFYIDSPTRNVDVFDFELETGKMRNRRTLFNFQNNNVTGVPDGMTIDTEGYLWIACYNGGKVIKVDSRSGKLLDEVKLPADKVTSVMWGGYDLSTLYVTTSRADLSPAELAQQPEAGSLFSVEGTGSRGRPEPQFVFDDASSY